jgi:hypothetical protein
MRYTNIHHSMYAGQVPFVHYEISTNNSRAKAEEAYFFGGFFP